MLCPAHQLILRADRVWLAGLRQNVLARPTVMSMMLHPTCAFLFVGATGCVDHGACSREGAGL